MSVDPYLVYSAFTIVLNLSHVARQHHHYLAIVTQSWNSGAFVVVVCHYCPILQSTNASLAVMLISWQHLLPSVKIAIT